MENPRPEKVAVVDEVSAKLAASDAALLTEYRGLDVTAMAVLRRALHEAGGEYKIYKNTLVRFAAAQAGLEIGELLTGPTAIAFVQGDAAGVAKVLRDYAKANPALVLKGGVLGTQLLSSDDVQALAELPSREQLLAEIAGVFAAPMQQFASLLDAVPRTFAYALQALIDAGGAPGAPASVSAEAEAAPAAEAPADEAPVDAAPAAEADAAPAAEVDEAPASDASTDSDTPDAAAESADDSQES